MNTELVGSNIVVLFGAIAALAASTVQVAKIRYCKYLVLDSYGTRQYCWTVKGAYSWLPYCVVGAVILNRHGKKLVCRKVSSAQTGDSIMTAIWKY